MEEKNNMKLNMKTAIYTRVSDGKLTTEGMRRQDISRQIDKLKKICDVQEWGDPVIFSDDNLSAFKDDYQSRPQFCKLLREIRSRRIQRVLVEDLTRWSRRIEDGLKTMKEVTEYGCTITSAAEGEIDITIPDGWFKCAVAFLLSEWSSRSQSWKIKNAMERMSKDKTKICLYCGVVHLGRHPLICKCEKCIKKGRLKF